MRIFRNIRFNNRGGIAYIKIIAIFSVFASMILCFKLLENNSDKLIKRNLIINDKIETHNINQLIKHITYVNTIELIERTIEVVDDAKSYDKAESYDNDEAEASDENDNVDDKAEETVHDDKNKIYMDILLEELRHKSNIFSVDSFDLARFGDYGEYIIRYSNDNIEDIIKLLLDHRSAKYENEEDTEADSENKNIKYRTMLKVDKRTDKDAIYNKNRYMLEIDIPLHPYDGNGNRKELDYENIVNMNMLLKHGDDHIE